LIARIASISNPLDLSFAAKMPKILSYTPAWLASPSLGHEIFTPARSASADGGALPTSYTNGGAKKAERPGPKRTIARRGAEVFIAVGKEIRWADLVYVKELYEVKQDKKFRGKGREAASDDGSSDDASEGYRVCALRPPQRVKLTHHRSSKPL
jgi:nucleoporin NUP82